MSRLMPDPWIQNLIRSNFTPDVSARNEIGSKIVQVIRVYDKINTIVINDKKNYIVVCLTRKACDEYHETYPSLQLLKNSIAKIDDFHVSTLMQNSSCRDIQHMKNELGLSLPFALQCNKIEFVGNSDLTVIAEPIDIHSESLIKELLSSMIYITLTTKLIANQFPDQRQLPDAEGRFLLPQSDSVSFDDTYISDDQLDILKNLTSYEHSDIVAYHANRRTSITKPAQSKASSNRLDTQVDETQVDVQDNSTVTAAIPIAAIDSRESPKPFAKDFEEFLSLQGISYTQVAQQTQVDEIDIRDEIQLDPIGPSGSSLVTCEGNIVISNDLNGNIDATQIEENPSKEYQSNALELIRDFCTQADAPMEMAHDDEDIAKEEPSGVIPETTQRELIPSDVIDENIPSLPSVRKLQDRIPLARGELMSTAMALELTKFKIQAKIAENLTQTYEDGKENKSESIEQNKIEENRSSREVFNTAKESAKDADQATRTKTITETDFTATKNPNRRGEGKISVSGNSARNEAHPSQFVSRKRKESSKLVYHETVTVIDAISKSSRVPATSATLNVAVDSREVLIGNRKRTISDILNDKLRDMHDRGFSIVGMSNDGKLIKKLK